MLCTGRNVVFALAFSLWIAMSIPWSCPALAQASTGADTAGGASSQPPWTIIDNDSDDWQKGGVTFTCSGGEQQTIKGAMPVSCVIPASKSITFKGPVSSCTANFDADWKFDPTTSTCKPVLPIKNSTLVFSAKQGISPGILWTIFDNDPDDWKGGGVAVHCPGGEQQIIDSAASVLCLIPASKSITFKGPVSSCTANFDADSKFDPTTSTCKPVLPISNSTLTFSPQQGISPGVVWTIIDEFPGDWADGGVTVQCPYHAKRAINSAATVSCVIPAKGSISLQGPLSSCTAKFDADSKFDPSTSSCVPTTTTGKTLTFPETAGITPPNQRIAFSFPKGTAGQVSASCRPSPCPSSVTSLTNSGLFLKRSLADNGPLTLSFKDSSAGRTCEVVLYDRFVDNNQTTCENTSVQSLGEGYPQNTLAFPETNGPLAVYPKAPGSAPSSPSIGTRTLTFTNQCDQPVWFSLVSGTVGPPPSHSAPVNTKANVCANQHGATGFTCPYGTTCRFVNEDTAFCFYDIPAPGTSRGDNLLDDYKLDAAGTPGGITSNTITLPIYSANDITFSGGASARAGCLGGNGDYTHCSIGNCNDDENALACGYTTGTSNGATIAEFTLQKTAVDFYDISVINGAHLPISFGTSPHQTPVASQQGAVVDQYWCNTPGSTTENGLRKCDWDFSSHLPTSTTPSGQSYASFYVNVTMPDISHALTQKGQIDLAKLSYCETDPDCSPQKCGLSYGLLSAVAATDRPSLFTTTGTNGKTGPLTCGERLGFNTPVNICSLITSGNDNYFQCRKTFTSTAPGGSKPISLEYKNLYSCDGDTTNCVQDKAAYTGKVCCGCTVWSDLHLGIESGQIGSQGKYKDKNIACTYDGPGRNSNPYWDGTTPGPDVLSKITFLKKACPTAYAYQFDDATSTFNCYAKPDHETSPSTFNATNYTIAFCPDGKEID